MASVNSNPTVDVKVILQQLDRKTLQQLDPKTLTYLPGHTIEQKYLAYKKAATVADAAITAYKDEFKNKKIEPKKALTPVIDLITGRTKKQVTDPNIGPTPMSQSYFKKTDHKVLAGLALDAAELNKVHAELRETFNTTYETVLRGQGLLRNELVFENHVTAAKLARDGEARYRKLHQEHNNNAV